MFRDLKEYQEIQNLYENKIYLSEDEEKKLEESLDFLESVDLSDEDLIYFFENIDQFIEDEELQNISENQFSYQFLKLKSSQMRNIMRNIK